MADRVDLDDYAEERLDDTQRAERRQLLLGQLRYLAAEAEALGGLLTAVPDTLLEGAPMPDDRSIKQTLGRLAALDRHVHTPRLAHLSGDASASPLDPEAIEDPGWNEHPVQELLDELHAARDELAARADALDADTWDQPLGEHPDLYRYLLAVTQHDADELRTLAYRLHESSFKLGGA